MLKLPSNPAFTPPSAFTTRPDLMGTHGMVSSTHWLASASANAVLEHGGNAFDAAVAGAFVLQVVEPHLNGPGGDMTGVFATAADPSHPIVLMGQGPAPRGANAEYYRSLGLDLVPGSGALAAAIPGAVDAWMILLRDYGTLGVGDVLQYAIDYARNGHPVLAAVSRTISGVSELFTEHWPTSARRWMPDGVVPTPGQIITNPEHAAVLQAMVDASQAAIAEGGSREEAVESARRAWRRIVGVRVEEFFATPHRHSDGGDYAGVMTAADLEDFSASYETPASIEFRGFTVAKVGAWSQGPSLLQALAILDGFDDELLDPSTEPGAHTVTEAMKLALADREVWYHDGLEEDALDYLLSASYAAGRRKLIGERASSDLRPGLLPGHAQVLPPLRIEYDTSAAPAGALPGSPPRSLVVGEPTVHTSVPDPPVDAASDKSAARGEVASAQAHTFGRPSGHLTDDLPTDANGVARGDTCHIDVVDAAGNMISATPSGGWLQSSPTIPGLGFCLGTRLQMMWLEPDSPTVLTPGLRPRTTLTPTLVLRDGKPILACGTPGGDQQDQWQLPLLLRVLVGGYTPQQAIDAPNLHTTSAPGSFWPRTWEPGGLHVEDRIGDDVIAALEARGHVVTRAGDWALGRLCVVTRDPETGVLGAAANPRGAQGYAVGR
jgi:gamma-glutamyltranspeptidase/glutathione hydrolase